MRSRQAELNEIAIPDTPAHWRDYSQPLVPPLLRPVLTCFYRYGFHGVSTRDLAAAMGMSVPGMYHHYKSKQAMLVELLRLSMTELYGRTLAALEEAGDSVERQLELVVECLVLFHSNRNQLAFIVSSENRCLEPEERERHIVMRDRQQRILDDIVERGVESGLFWAENPRLTSRAIVTMCTSVSRWFRLDGPLTPAVLAEQYIALAKRTLGMSLVPST